MAGDGAVRSAVHHRFGDEARSQLQRRRDALGQGAGRSRICPVRSRSSSSRRPVSRSEARTGGPPDSRSAWATPGEASSRPAMPGSASSAPPARPRWNGCIGRCSRDDPGPRSGTCCHFRVKAAERFRVKAAERELAIGAAVNPVWLWIFALVLYGTLLPLVQQLASAAQRRRDRPPHEPLRFPRAGGLDPARLAAVRRFLEADDGREFFMVNLSACSRGRSPSPARKRSCPPRRCCRVHGLLHAGAVSQGRPPRFFARARAATSKPGASSPIRAGASPAWSATAAAAT